MRPAPDELPIQAFASADELHAWLEAHHATSPGIWLRLFKKNSGCASASFEAVLDEGLCFGWSESARRAYDDVSYLQRFTPRKAPGTRSPRNKARARALIRAGRMTPTGRQALGLTPPAPTRRAGAR